MDIKKIKELIKIVEESDITGLSIEEGKTKVEIKKYTENTQVIPAAAPIAIPAKAAIVSSTETKADDHGGLTPVKSPMTGTYYASPSPDSPPFIKVGDHVTKGQTVCIVEAMKTFNEIESEVNGTVAKILLSNATAVEFGQPMILIKEG
jgi:acetyl-CoA carboxylase biotin carboxyl carrier protein